MSPGLQFKARGILLHAPWVLLAAAVPFYLFPSPARWPGMLLLPLGGLAYWLVFRRPLPVTRLNPILLLFSLSVLGSAWTTYDLSISLPKLAGVVMGLALFFLAAGYGSRPAGWNVLALTFVMVGVAVAVVGLTGMQRPSAEDYSKIPILYRLLVRIPLLFLELPGAQAGINPNELGGSLLWVFYPTLALWLAVVFVKRDNNDKKNTINRVPRLWFYIRFLFLSCSLAFIGLALVLAQSRAAILGLVLTLPFLVIGILPRRIRGYAGVVFVCVIVVFVVLLVPYGKQLLSVNLTDNIGSAQGVLSVTTFVQRVQIWQYGLDILRDFPMTGIGMNTFRYVVFRLVPLSCVITPCDIGHAHNELLQAGLDLGLPGLAAFLGLHVGAFWILIRLYRQVDRLHSSSLYVRLVILGLGGGLVSHFVFGMLDAVALGAKPGLLFWMLLGLVYGLGEQYSD